MQLTYIDETDRSYGLSGMAISLAVLDNGEKIMEINLDGDDPINFSHEFFFTGNPRCSAKVVWNELTNNFNLSMAMALGNILSRRIASEHVSFAEEEQKTLREIAINEGRDICGLETDEVETLWEKDLHFLSRVFGHPQIQRLTKEMAQEIRRKRTLSRQEINEILSVINRW